MNYTGGGQQHFIRERYARPKMLGASREGGPLTLGSAGS